MEFQSLVLKNITRSRLFFPPLNRYVDSMKTVDLLAMCDGNSVSAGNIAQIYRKSPSWQIFELMKGNFPSPEGEVSNDSAPLTPIDPDAPQPSGEPPAKKKPGKLKPQTARKAYLDEAGVSHDGGPMPSGEP